jgi:uncharacterized repeat protein (TIGR01451 family)
MPGLVYSFANPELGMGPYLFEAPVQGPSAFKVEGTAGAQKAKVVPAAVNWWQDRETPDGKTWTVKLAHPLHENFVAPADVTVTARSESDVATILGASPGEEPTARAFVALSERIDRFEEVRTVTLTGCTPAAREEALRKDQQAVLEMLGHRTILDLTRLDNEADLAALAAVGYDLYLHQQVSFEGIGWVVYNPAFDPANRPVAEPSAGRPPILTYEPNGPNMTGPRDGPFDFPYTLRGWFYIADFNFADHPAGPEDPVPDCIGREEWFVHERGLHPFETGGMKAIPPPEENHGTAPGDSNDPNNTPPPEAPGDIPHGRAWDLHIWCVPDCANPVGDIPSVSLLNPGPPIAGLGPPPGYCSDTWVCLSPPPGWPEPPYPAFYYPQRVADFSLEKTDSPDRVATGGALTYTLVVFNKGPDSASEVRVTDTLPASVTFTSAAPSQGSCTESGGTVTCNLATITRDSSATVHIMVKPRVAGTITNIASVTSALTDLTTTNNSDAEETSVCRTTSRKSSVPCP